MKIDLLRHGETLAGRCFLGSTDAGLSEAGWRQMKGAALCENYQKIISSPLKRCADFAQFQGENWHIPVEISNDLREIHFGDWETKTTDDLWQSNKQSLSAFWGDPLNNMPPGAESLVAFQVRVNLALTETLKRNEKYDRILLVVHGGVIRQILANILSIDFVNTQRIQIDYASLTQINSYEKHLSIQFVNKAVF